jgi:hypothetical protein
MTFLLALRRSYDGPAGAVYIIPGGNPIKMSYTGNKPETYFSSGIPLS